MAREFSRPLAFLAAAMLERTPYTLRDVAPDHFAANAVGVLAHGMARCVVAQQTDHLAAMAWASPERHQHAAVVGQQFLRVPVRRGTTALPEPNA